MAEENTTSGGHDLAATPLTFDQYPPIEPEEYRGNAGYWCWRPFRKGPNSQHKRAMRREASPKTGVPRSVIGSLCNELWAWKVDRYPGRIAMLAHVCGVERGTAEQWSKGAGVPGARARERLAGWVRAKAARLNAIADEIEALEVRAPGWNGWGRARKLAEARAVAGVKLPEGVQAGREGEMVLEGPERTAEALGGQEGLYPAVPGPKPVRALPAGAVPLGSGRDGKRPLPAVRPKVPPLP